MLRLGNVAWNFHSGYLAWELEFGKVHSRMLAWDLSFESVRLEYLACGLSLGIFRLDVCCVGTFAWHLRLRELDSCNWGSLVASSETKLHLNTLLTGEAGGADGSDPREPSAQGYFAQSLTC